MVSLRFLIWLALSAVAFCVGLVLLAITRQIPSLDHGWINAMLILGVWCSVVAGLKQMLLDGAVGEEVSLQRRVAASTLEYRRR